MEGHMLLVSYTDLGSIEAADIKTRTNVTTVVIPPFMPKRDQAPLSSRNRFTMG